MVRLTITSLFSTSAWKETKKTFYSASAPCFAAVVSLLNEHRLQNGKKQLGYLNPFLYKNIAAFTDITKGTNAIGRGNGPIKYGFNATKGWDPATGKWGL